MKVDPELVAVVEAEVKAWIAQPWTDVEDRGFETLTRRLLQALEPAIGPRPLLEGEAAGRILSGLN